jgi:hypothetical protein
MSYIARPSPRPNGLSSAYPVMTPIEFCDAIDARLNEVKQAPAQWPLELAALYEAGLSVEASIPRILAGRKVKKRWGFGQ